MERPPNTPPQPRRTPSSKALGGVLFAAQALYAPATEAPLTPTHHEASEWGHAQNEAKRQVLIQEEALALFKQLTHLTAPRAFAERRSVLHEEIHRRIQHVARRLTREGRLSASAYNKYRGMLCTELVTLLMQRTEVPAKVRALYLFMLEREPSSEKQETSLAMIVAREAHNPQLIAELMLLTQQTASQERVSELDAITELLREQENVFADNDNQLARYLFEHSPELHTQLTERYSNLRTELALDVYEIENDLEKTETPEAYASAMRELRLAQATLDRVDAGVNALLNVAAHPRDDTAHYDENTLRL